jgi:RNA polymerase sigma factor (sigma-70 family)
VRASGWTDGRAPALGALPAPAAAVRSREVPMTELSDEQLFQCYTDGNEAGFQVLMERYEPRIQGFLRKRLNDEERVEDLTQDTFLRIHRARGSYDPSRKFSTWIHTIANNLLKNEFRNRSRRRETVFSELRPENSASAGAGAAGGVRVAGRTRSRRPTAASCARRSTPPSSGWTSTTASRS